VNVDVTRREHEDLVPLETDPELRTLFHRLNNQLGIILAQAELLEVRAANDESRARAEQVVASVLMALGTAREIRLRTEAPETGHVGL
jgi:hypothetical protein